MSQKVKAWSTKYLFTKGIMTVEGELTEKGDLKGRDENGRAYRHAAHEVHLTFEDAVKAARKKADNKVTSLRKQLRKVENLRRELRLGL